MKKHCFILIVFFLFMTGRTLQAQQAVKALPGTYQIQVDEKSAEVFTTEALEQIEIRVESARLESQDTYLRLSPSVQVFIPSREHIHDASFVPYAEVIIRITGVYQN